MMIVDTLYQYIVSYKDKKVCCMNLESKVPHCSDLALSLIIQLQGVWKAMLKSADCLIRFSPSMSFQAKVSAKVKDLSRKNTFSTK